MRQSVMFLLCRNEGIYLVRHPDSKEPTCPSVCPETSVSEICTPPTREKSMSSAMTSSAMMSSAMLFSATTLSTTTFWIRFKLLKASVTGILGLAYFFMKAGFP